MLKSISKMRVTNPSAANYAATSTKFSLNLSLDEAFSKVNKSDRRNFLSVNESTDYESI